MSSCVALSSGPFGSHHRCRILLRFGDGSASLVDNDAVASLCVDLLHPPALQVAWARL